MSKLGKDQTCALCFGAIEDCRCSDASRILDTLYGYSIEDKVLRQKDVRIVASRLEEANRVKVK